MVILENFALLVLISASAYIFTCIFQFINRKIEKFNLKRNNDFYKFKCKKIYNNIYNYYYTLAVINPERLCKELASINLMRIKKEKKINKMYDLLKKEVK